MISSLVNSFDLDSEFPLFEVPGMLSHGPWNKWTRTQEALGGRLSSGIAVRRTGETEPGIRSRCSQPGVLCGDGGQQGPSLVSHRAHVESRDPPSVQVGLCAPTVAVHRK